MRGDELLRDFDAKEKTSAGSGNIETGGIRCADLFLNKTGRGRTQHVRRGRGDKNKIDFGRRNLRLIDRFQRSFRRQVAGLLVLCSDAPTLDPGSGDYTPASSIHYAL